MEAMTDSPHWQTALLTLDWDDDLSRLENWIRGRTFAPHWTEFERSWLRRYSEITKVPPLSHILKGCLEAWAGGANDYYIKHPDSSLWHERDGLGHYIRILTMIVRENMATNGIWPIESGREVRRYFEKALVLVNCMREEWTRKGLLYEHFQKVQAQREGESMLHPT